jgi:dTDP-4-amino-4,6-dideoxygalactose transaminase
MRNFGFTGYDEVAGLGTNGKMSEASAAMGLTLESLDSFLAANQRNHEQYP